MQLREIESRSVSEARMIMSQQWSRHDLSTQSPEDFHLRLRSRTFSEDMSLNFVSYGSAVRIDPGAHDPVLLLMMPFKGEVAAAFPDGEVHARSDQFALVDVRRVLHVDYSAGLEMLVLRIRISRLKTYIEAALGIAARQELQFLPEMRDGSAGWTGWAPTAAALMGIDACRESEISHRILAPLEETILATLLMSQPNAYQASLKQPAPSIAPSHVRRAEDYIHANAGNALTTEVVALMVGVSVRALFDGFKAFRGMTPADFIRKVRLEHARADLLAGRETVSKIASKWGFGHTGNFARHYRNRYREAPSQTIRLSYGVRL